MVKIRTLRNKTRRQVLSSIAGTTSIPIISKVSTAANSREFDPHDLRSVIKFVSIAENDDSDEYREFVESLSGKNKEAIMDLSRSWFIRHTQTLRIDEIGELSASELIITDKSIPAKWNWDVRELRTSSDMVLRSRSSPTNMLNFEEYKLHAMTESECHSGSANYSDKVEESIPGIIGYEWEHWIDWDFSYCCDLYSCWNDDASNGTNNHNPWTGPDVSYDGVVSESSYYKDYNSRDAYHSDRQVKFSYWTPSAQFEWYPYIDIVGNGLAIGQTKDKYSGVD